MGKILIIEDEVKLREELKALITRNGYECEVILDFENIIEEIFKIDVDLILLDINLPKFDGFYICKEIRKTWDVPIIMVTSQNGDIDELEALSLGADDFISKPFNPRILLAHIEAVLKRTSANKKSILINHNGLTLDVLKSKAYYNDKTIELTKNELGILKVLMDNRGNIIPRNEIICVLWEMEDFIEDATLTVNINRLRKKLSDVGLEDYLITKRGQGYMV